MSLTNLTQGTAKMSMNDDLDRPIKKFLQYMDVKHEIKDVFAVDEKVAQDITSEKGTSDFKTVTHFFNILLSYHYNNNILPDTDHHDPSTQDEFRISRLRCIFPGITETMAIKLYDTVDVMYLIIQGILADIKVGFSQSQLCSGITLTSGSLPPDLDVLFYIVFYNTFQSDLRDTLRQELHILSDIENKILDKCNGKFFKGKDVWHNKHASLCTDIDVEKLSKKLKCDEKGILANMFHISGDKLMKGWDSKSSKENPSIAKYVKLGTPIGIIVLIKIFSDLRPFSRRRQSKQ